MNKNDYIQVPKCIYPLNHRFYLLSLISFLFREKERLLVSVPLILALTSQSAFANCHPELQDCIEADSWALSVALGGGAISNPLYGGDPIPLLLLPSISYYGKQFYIENTQFGYTLNEQRHYAVSLSAGLNEERAFFFRWHPTNFFTPSGYSGSTGQQPIEPEQPSDPSDSVSDIDKEFPEFIGPDDDQSIGQQPNDSSGNNTPLPSVGIDDVSERKWAIDGGLRFNYFSDAGNWQLKAMTDISGVHNGYYLDLYYQKALTGNKWSHVLSLGASYKDKNLVDYYYGIDEKDNVDARLHYQGKGSINPYIRWFGTHAINNTNWHFIYWLGLQQLGSGISNSPLVKADLITNGFIGFSYKVI